MDLPQIRRGRVASRPGAVLHRLAEMRVADHAQPGAQRDRGNRKLAEAMVTIAVHRNDLGAHERNRISEAWSSRTCCTSTCSSALCARFGPPEPKFSAEMPNTPNQATSVLPSFARGSPLTAATNSAATG